jgi:hypothetical protein
VSNPTQGATELDALLLSLLAERYLGVDPWSFRDLHNAAIQNSGGSIDVRAIGRALQRLRKRDHAVRQTYVSNGENGWRITKLGIEALK